MSNDDVTMPDPDVDHDYVRECDKDGPDMFGMVWERLNEMDERLISMEATLEAIKGGVNVIGEMMNQVAIVFDGLAEKVKQGGVGALLGGLMGGKKIDG